MDPDVACGTELFLPQDKNSDHSQGIDMHHDGNI
jgi:hypothetical protein